MRISTLYLNEVRERTLAYCEELRDKETPYGHYRRAPRGRHDLYATLDVAHIRHVMGEDLLASLSVEERVAWIAHINSYISGVGDGSYTDRLGSHSALHANGMVVGALGVLGGKQALPVRLYDSFDEREKVVGWLEAIDWTNQWSASHLFWGGMHCFSFSRRCSEGWRATVFSWLDANLDDKTGWWRRGTSHADRHQPLGGSVHILPIYEHHGRAFPYPEKLIDSVLGLQLDNGRWLSPNNDTGRRHVMGYLELDALYALTYASSLASTYRSEDIIRAARRYAKLVQAYWRDAANELFTLHPHYVLAAVGTFGLLSRLLPDAFPTEAAWTDIFSSPGLYQTDQVEVLA